jgi:hypothetical protein
MVEECVALVFLASLDASGACIGAGEMSQLDK